MESRLFRFMSVLAVALTAFAGCSFEIDEEARDHQLGLAGYWETCHIVEDDVVTEPDGTVTENHVNANVSIDSPNRDEYYGVIRFTESTVSYVATFDPETALILGKHFPYSLKGNKVYSWLMRGDFTDFVTIEELTDTKLVLKLVDNGTDEDGIYNDFQQIITFNRIK